MKIGEPNLKPAATMPAATQGYRFEAWETETAFHAGPLS